MKLRQFACLAALQGLSWSSLGSANDSSFGGAGADLVPIAQKNVAMTAEKILLVYENGRFSVTAEYWFENRGEKEERVQVGFPEYRCPDDEGKRVKHRQGQLKKQQAWAPYLGTVWLFDVGFPPKKPIHIVHRYSLAGDQSVMMDGGTTYVTRTGSVWAGSIGKAEFTFLLPPDTHTVDGDFERPELVERDGKSWLEVKLTRTDWEPKDDISIRFTSVALDYLAPPGPPEKRCVGAPSNPPEKQACKNLIYAVAGYRFQNEDWNRYFYSGKSGFQRGPSAYDEKVEVWRRALEPVDAFVLSRIDEGSMRRLELDSIPAEPPGRATPTRAPATKPVAPPVPEPAVQKPAASEAAPAPASKWSGFCAYGHAGGPLGASLVVAAVSLVALRRRRSVPEAAS